MCPPGPLGMPQHAPRHAMLSLSCASCLSCSQLPLMNQWKDEFKAHSRVKCPNSGCWLEFPSIYGLKYHYQRCQGVRRLEGCLPFPVASSTIYRVKPLLSLKPHKKCEMKMERAQMGQGQFVRCVREGLGSRQLSVRSGLGDYGPLVTVWRGGRVLHMICVCACIKKKLSLL